MKNSSLVLFAAVILLGWTSLAAGLIASFAGQPAFVSRAHGHQPAPTEVSVPGPLYSNVPAAQESLTLAARLPHGH